MKSVLTDEEYYRTKLIVEDFGKPGGKGEMLQEKLRKVSESKDNWVITMKTWTEFFCAKLTTSLINIFLNFKCKYYKYTNIFVGNM